MTVVVILKNNEEYYCELVEFDYTNNFVTTYQLGERISVDTFKMIKDVVIELSSIKEIY
jgi:small nuclear ribonucleoprotein (snRNP)-like protein